LAGGYTSSVDNTQRALVWDRFDAAPREVDFGRLNGMASVINNRGQVAGTGWDNYSTDGALNTSYFYDGGQAVHIESPTGTTNRTRAAGLNDHGTVLATWGPTEGSPSAGAFLWRDGAVVADLCALAADHSLMFSALNARDQVVLGHRGLGGDPLQRTYLYDAGAVTTLTGPNGGDVSITGTLTERVNRPLSDRGHVVGSYQADTGTRAFLWHRGSSVDLGTLGGTTIATAVNNRGEVAGTSDTADGTARAFLWRRGEMLALDPPGADYASTSAAWITDQGTVLGYAVTTDGDQQAVQWTVR
jgi:probable HAF family extracellular repeat protein